MSTFKPSYHRATQTSTPLTKGLCGNCNAPEVFPNTYICAECANDHQISLEHLKQQSSNTLNQTKD